MSSICTARSTPSQPPHRCCARCTWKTTGCAGRMPPRCSPTRHGPTPTRLPCCTAIQRTLPPGWPPSTRPTARHGWSWSSSGSGCGSPCCARCSPPSRRCGGPPCCCASSATPGQDVGFPVPVGGAGELAAALARRAEATGAQLRTGQHVERIEVAGDRAVGVRTAAGLTVHARRAVIADVSAPSLYLDLLPPPAVPYALRDDLRRFQWDSPVVKVNW